MGTLRRMGAHLVRCRYCGRRNRLPDAGPAIPRCGHCRNPLPWITEAGDDDFAEIADGSTIAVLVDIWAPWCPLCSRANPALDRLAGLLAGQVKLVKVNAARTPGLAQVRGQSVPTLLRSGPLLPPTAAVVRRSPRCAPGCSRPSQAVITRPVPVR